MRSLVVHAVMRKARAVFDSEAWVVKKVFDADGKVLVEVVRRRDGKHFTFEYDPREDTFRVVR